MSIPVEVDAPTKPAIGFTLSEVPATNFRYYSDSQVIDPLSIPNISVSKESAYTFDSSLRDSSIYVSTLIADGMNLDYLEQDDEQASLILSNSMETIRINIRDGLLSIFHKTLKGREGESIY